MGGLMGLCLGFSLLSFIELIYWATYRVARNARARIWAKKRFQPRGSHHGQKPLPVQKEYLQTSDQCKTFRIAELSPLEGVQPKIWPLNPQFGILFNILGSIINGYYCRLLSRNWVLCAPHEWWRERSPRTESAMLRTALSASPLTFQK